MKIVEITLTEAPIPEDWDSTIYNPTVSFAKRVKYAKERALQLGSGSSRVAFEIPYKGRKTVLKVAKNTKGMAQNNVESEILGDHILSNIVIPMIDFDETSSSPTWIHIEKADKVTPTMFKTLSGGDDIKTFVSNAAKMAGKYHTYVSDDEIAEIAAKMEDNELLADLVFFIGNYDIIHVDFYALRNWGVYKGKLVIIDVGLDSKTLKTYYS